jgi:hypothetical protein
MLVRRCKHEEHSSLLPLRIGSLDTSNISLMIGGGRFGQTEDVIAIVTWIKRLEYFFSLCHPHLLVRGVCVLH